MSRPILAAGTVCWRRVRDESGTARLMILLIHRTKQKDVSFPKGKLDKGESMPQAAVRETLEETGLRVALGVNLGTITYELPDGGERKTVQYWAAEVTEEAVLESTFRPNREVEALEWVPFEAARSRLSYRADRDLFDVFASLVERGAIDTFSVILLRHAKAESRSDAWPEDRLRPLTDAGEDQAETLVPTLEAFGPQRVFTSSSERCLRTVDPLARRLDLAPRARDGLSQEAWDDGETAELRSIIGKTVRKGRSTVICTHRPVLPDAARELALATGSLPGSYLDEAAALPPAGFSVFHLSRERPGSGILGVETYPLKH
ncbi:NUDIX domain-containing protein [Leucobacter soli]|uniref:8-oxo-dGTP diphosphatase 1 n=1 Tax=Leucobacter soli TaxID=2812850 RepID=A0A916JUK9_9MICO|nr:NUDIX domain-containing protein [Leucobacter soli]CAG7603981.1 putative 8-oxo-dGTP diphosphatase 1 [Leucobacter soli]